MTVHIQHIFKSSLLYFFICLLAYWLIGLLVMPQALALTMTNGLYIVQMGNLNSIAGNVSSTTNKLSITSGETGSGLYSLNGVNYKVRAGFQYVRSIISFSFSIQNPAVDFGILTATIPVNRTSNLVVSNGSAHGYVVTASESNALQTGTNATIPDTTCDNGLCTPTSAGPWALNTDGSSTTYGFGYNCTNISGTQCPSDFASSSYFRPFAASPSAAIVMSSSNVGRNQTVQITYRVNTSPTQPSGLYTNTITYIATPTF